MPSMSVDNGLKLSTLNFYSISTDLFAVSRCLRLLTFSLMRIWRGYILLLRLSLYQPYSFHLPLFSESL